MPCLKISVLKASLEETTRAAICLIERPSSIYFWWRKHLFLHIGGSKSLIESMTSSGGCVILDLRADGPPLLIHYNF
jgi:hypothetical protein